MRAVQGDGLQYADCHTGQTEFLPARSIAMYHLSSKQRRGRKSKFQSLIIEKDFEPENPKKLEELDENSCKWPIGHPEEQSFYFCGRSSLKDFSYCKLHLLYAYQPKGRKEEPVADKDEEAPQYLSLIHI